MLAVVALGKLLRDLDELEPDELQAARFEASEDGSDQRALHAVGLHDDQSAFQRHAGSVADGPNPSCPCCSAEIEGLFSLEAALFSHTLLIRADSLDLSESTVATGYCMKCKAQREIKNAKQITMKNGRPATEGACPVCGTKIFKIGAGK